MAAGCYPRAPGLHSGELAELGLSGLMSHPDTRQDASSLVHGIPAAFRHSSGVGMLGLDVLSSLWLTRASEQSLQPGFYMR